MRSSLAKWQPDFGINRSCTAVGGSAQLYANTWTGDRHEGTRQGDRGCERSSHWRPPRQPLAPEVVLRASGPLRPPSDEQEGASRSRQALGLEGRTGMVYWGDAKHEQASSLSHERVGPPPEGPKKRKN